MAIATVQTFQGDSNGYRQNGSITVTGVTAGNTLVMIGASGEDSPTYSDDKSNTWTNAVQQSAFGFRQVTIAYAPVTTGGTIIITQTTTNFSDSSFIVREYSGLLTASALDQVVGAEANSTTQTATTPSTTQANELVVVGLCIDSQSTTITGDAGYTTLVTQLSSASQFTQGALQDKTVSATGAQSATMTLSSAQLGAIAIATFKEASAPSNTTNFFQFI